MTRATVTFIRRVWDPSPCAGRRTVCICWWRSEEHTSELQSRSDLVCRLLLEKKNYLALVGPPLPEWCRASVLLVLGTVAGLANMALFHAISLRYQAHSTRTSNRGHLLHTLAC